MNDNYMDLLRKPKGHNMNVMAERFNHIINKIDPNTIKVLLEVGSMDAWESINMARIFKDASIYTFEPVPYNIERCRENIANHPDVANRIFLQEIAANDITGPMTFWALDIEAAKVKNNLNHGIGSKFKIMNPDMWFWEHNQQKAINVKGYRLDDWCKNLLINCVDGIWMDAQGSELDILKGAGSIINNVRFIITEAGLIPYYEGQSLKSNIDEYLINYGFVEYKPAARAAHEYEADVIYLNTNLIKE
jgi:FkbM family methyltransferase